ncbi:MAG TPA: hypothetical protein VFQ51_10965, partial [Vicinamibacteria bacterium]|nr:hypothetical protein [Vicinamibacteria bacterium]
TGELERITRDLAARERDLSQLEGDAAEEGGGLNDRLDELATTLAAAEDDARGAVEDLGTAGSDAQDAIGDSLERLDDAVGQLGERAQEAADAVEEGHARLTEQGFEALGRALDGLQHDVDAAREEAATLTTGFVGAVEACQADCEAAWCAAQGVVDQAATEAVTLHASLETSATEAAEDLKAEAEEIETVCASLEGDLTAIYEGLADGAQGEQEALSDAIRSTASELTTRVEGSEIAQVEQPGESVEQNALAPLDAELAQLAATLAGAAPLTDALPPLTAELARCAAVAGRIEELLQAMAG